MSKISALMYGQIKKQVEQDNKEKESKNETNERYNED